MQILPGAPIQPIKLLMQNSKDKADRRLRALIREHDELRERCFTIVKLDRPIQRGWRRLHVLTENARNRPDCFALESILEVIGTVVVHHSRDFRKKRGRSRKLVEIEQPLRSIRPYEWSRLGFSAAWQPYFRYELVLEWNRHWQPRWVFTQPSLFELKVERNWLWYFREVDPAVESRLSEIARWLETHNGWARYRWLHGRTQHYRWGDPPSARQKFLKRAHRREIDRALAIFPEVDPASLAQRIRISRWSFFFPGVAQCRGNELRPRRVRVQVLPPGPFSSSRSPTQRQRT